MYVDASWVRYCIWKSITAETAPNNKITKNVFILQTLNVEYSFIYFFHRLYIYEMVAFWRVK